MRPSSARPWEELISKFDRLHVYTVDPGAHAVARELVPLLRAKGRLGAWYTDGWSAAQAAGSRPAAELPDALQPRDALLIGSQTNFAKTQDMLGKASAAGATTIFVFDHWKNYGEHFGRGKLADIIVVPDEIAGETIAEVLGEEARSHVRVLPHLAIEAAADRILSSGIAVQPGTIAFLLDPTENAHGLGYDWRTALSAAVKQELAGTVRQILVKPHPRQDAGEVTREIALLRRPDVEVDMFIGETEDLVASASEVWGMTTVVLNVALAVGKPIRSFQCGRNDAGARASNPHIEPYVVK